MRLDRTVARLAIGQDNGGDRCAHREWPVAELQPVVLLTAPLAEYLFMPTWITAWTLWMAWLVARDVFKEDIDNMLCINDM